jgi:proline iminopeptidase
LDISSPLETAWKLHRAWPGSELKVVDNEGHGGTFMSKEIANAINKI